MVDHRWMKRIGRSDGASDRMLIRPLGQRGADLVGSQIRLGRFRLAGSDRGHGLQVVGVIGLVEQAGFYRIVHNDGRLPAQIGRVRNRNRIGRAGRLGGERRPGDGVLRPLVMRVVQQVVLVRRCVGT